MVLLFLLNLALLALGFVLLTKGADFLVDGATELAEKFKIPAVIIGLTIVAIGTSLPEAAVSIAAGLKGSPGISIGNVFGSNILNVLLILGLTSLIYPLNVEKSCIRFGLPFTIMISALAGIYGFLTHRFNRLFGLLFWGFLLFYFYMLFRDTRKVQAKSEDVPSPTKSDGVILLMIVGGLISIVVGSQFTVDSASALASMLGMSDRFIGLTIVAFGTSLPELVTCVVAARKKQADIAIGNIIGSNIFNLLFVLGTTALITPVPFSDAFSVDAIVCILAVVVLYLLVHSTSVLSRKGGLLLLLSYLAYDLYLVL